MRTLFITRGLPGSGKSTTLRHAGLQDFTLSTDALRLLVSGPMMTMDGRMTISQDVNQVAWGHLLRMLEERMRRGDTTVVDAVHATAGDFSAYIKLARTYAYELVCLDFTGVPRDYHEWTNQGRAEHRVVPGRAMDRLQSLLEASEPLPKNIRNVRIRADNGHLAEITDILSAPFLPLDLSGWKAVVLIGDLQGCLSPLREALGDEGLREDTFYIFVGDYCDRGEENAAVIHWLTKHAVGRDNVILLEGNHEHHLRLLMRGEKPVSEEFARHTLPDFRRNGVEDAQIEALTRQLRTHFFYTAHGQNVMVSHGGLPTVPRSPWMVPCAQFIKGVGYYDQDVDAAFSSRAPSGWFQVHGHRNSHDVPLVASSWSFNLEASVEDGGHLRLLRHDTSGFTPQEVRNHVVRPFVRRHHRKGDFVPFWMQQSEEEVLKKRFMPADELAALRSHSGVRERQSISYPHVSSLSFTKDVFYGKTWDDIVNKARGLFINKDSGEIVARSYEKFFTVGENESMSLESLRARLSFPLTGMLKENGFLGITGYDAATDSLFVASKSTPDGPFAEMFRSILNATLSGSGQEKLKRALRDYDASAVFEVIDPLRDPHMVEYEKPTLVLLDVVHRSADFERFSRGEVQDFGKKFGFDTAQRVVTLRDWPSFEGWYRRSARDMSKEYEGLVFTDGRGEMFKTKTPFYAFWKLMRGTKDAILRERQGGRLPVSRQSMGDFLEGRGLGFLTAEADAFKTWAFEQEDDILSKDIIAVRKIYEAALVPAVFPAGPG